MFIQTVALKEVKCYAFHGFYPEEQLTGNHFLVDMEVSFIPSLSESEDLRATVNYEVLNTIVMEEMKNTQKLLETVVRNMINRLLQHYSFLEQITVAIKKIRPPMPGEIGYSFVQLHYKATP